MKSPKVTCTAYPSTLTIELPLGSWPCSRDFFGLLADAVKDKAESLAKHESDKEDAAYLDIIADAMFKAIDKADQDDQRNIANIFE